ncbi:hypothetical protein KFL_001920090 [Klebsormidium nitens]|uniref:Transmembrane protein n=1 Tax=Klebsormidium nitens TaxID=105231 RepID=A0A1Y1I8T2_KLENI|nr:hypothetical protein KFL_001920090 [Klebsormidium nitens]|eukprot:GAQ84508.1 hypothetical protein KFL_001920090 [Klebsormidium nitens]
MVDSADRPQEGQESWEGKFYAAKEHFHTYPYVWYSYITVFGSLSAALAFSYGRMRGSENRLREVQARMKLLRMQREGATASRGANPSEQKPL